MLSTVDSPLEATEPILERLQCTGNNEELLATIKEAIQGAAFTEFSPNAAAVAVTRAGITRQFVKDLTNGV